MAGLTTRGGPPNDRAQVILVAAFALAVSFVALSVIINGAIFTQNLATRGDTAGSGDALHYRQQAERMVGDSLSEANGNYSGHATILAETRASIGALDRVSGYQQAVDGKAVNYSYAGATNGTRIYQDSDADFTNTSSATDWVVAEGVSNTRQFDIAVTTSSLRGSLSNSLTVNVSDGSDRWETNVYESATDEVTVETTTGNGATLSCVATGSEVDINVTAGLLGGQPCEALDFAEGLSGSYEIAFNNSDEVTGQYTLTVDQDSSSLIGDAPNTDEAVYSVTVQNTYRTVNLEYETEIRVAPGEPDD